VGEGKRGKEGRGRRKEGEEGGGRARPANILA